MKRQYHPRGDGRSHQKLLYYDEGMQHFDGLALRVWSTNTQHANFTYVSSTNLSQEKDEDPIFHYPFQFVLLLFGDFCSRVKYKIYSLHFSTLMRVV